VKQKREQKILIVLTLKGRDSKTLYGYYFDAGRQNLRQRRVGSVGSSTFRWCRGPGLHHASNRISGFLGGLTAFTSEATMTERRRETWRIFGTALREIGPGNAIFLPSFQNGRVLACGPIKLRHWL
jgi:hypothetical protein